VSSTTATQAVDCERDEERVDLPGRADEFAYTDGLSADGRADWTGGEIVQFGAEGDCSLSVTNGSAALTATAVDGERGVLRATVDVGRGGALTLSKLPVASNGTRSDGPVVAATNATTPTIAVRNLGAENDPRIELVTRGPGGTVDSLNTTAPSGRFFDLGLRFRGDGTVRVAVWDTDDAEPGPGDWHTLRAVRENETTAGAWRVGLRARAYLDEVAVGSRDVPDDSAGLPGDEDERGPDDGAFPTMPPNEVDAAEDERDPATGLVLGPLLALVGAGIFKFAYGLTRFNEQLDAIGSTTRSSEVEPAGWNVALTRFVGAAIAVGGLLWMLSSLVTILS
jgi:hypothetical protein